MFAFDLSKSVIGKASIKIERPVQEVYDYVAVHFFENYPKWALEVIEFKPINNNPMKVGALARQTRIDQGQKIESIFEIMVMQPNELLILNGLSAPYRNSYLFQAIHNNEETLLTFSFELLELEIFMRPFEKLIRTAIEEGAQNTVQNIYNLITRN
ncbi:MAG: hypothetical protein ACU83N_15240 [Gammaproteobacteria bacterium]